MNRLVAALNSQLPALVTAVGPRASKRVPEFFTAQIRNLHTGRAYGQAVADFLTSCSQAGVPSLERIEPFHVAGHVELVNRER